MYVTETSWFIQYGHYFTQEGVSQLITMFWSLATGLDKLPTGNKWLQNCLYMKSLQVGMHVWMSSVSDQHQVSCSFLIPLQVC